MASASPVQLLTLLDGHGAALAEYSMYPDDDLLCVHWHGHLTGAEIIRGLEQSSVWRDQFHYSLILNDKTDTSGDWSDALPWLQYEWLPSALKAGVKAMAYVFSPDRDNRFASRNLVLALRPHMAIELFEEMGAAMAWLAQQEPQGGSHAKRCPHAKPKPD